MTTIRRTALAAALFAASFGAHAATTVTWNFTSGGDGTSPYANQSSWTVDGKTVTLRAFYVDAVANSTDAMGNSTINSAVASSTASKAMKFGNGTTQAGVATFGGNGVGIANPYDGPQSSGQESSSGGQHAIDNYDYNSSTGVYNPSGALHAHDFLLFDFNEVLAPTDFRIGWKAFANTDIDIFIAPETVTSGFDLNGKSVNDLITAGWTRATFTNVQDCVSPGTGTPCPTTFSSGSYSNSGGALSGMPANLKSRYMVAAGVLGGNDDAFKFASITMNVPGGGTTDVPVPAPLALLAIGGLAMAITRRRKAA